MTIIEQSDDLTHVALKGSLGMEGVHRVDLEFHNHTSKRKRATIVDLSQVDFMSSLGIGMLVGCAQGLRRRGLPMVLLNPQPLVETTLRGARIDRVIPIAGTMDDAMAVINGGDR